MWNALLISLRPKQWIKNLFVFAALVFVGDFTDWHKVLLVSAAFVCFSLASSAVYLFNDVIDRERDRAHPVKRARPIASGALSVPFAVSASILLAVPSVLGAMQIHPRFTLVLASYLLLQLWYSLYLKHAIILDVFSVSAGFVLRVVGGAVAIAVPVSVWIILCTFFLTLFLAIGKRRGELALSHKDTREVLQSYSPELLQHMNTLSLSATLITYTFYTFSSEHSRLFMLTIPIVLYGLLYYLYALEKSGGESDPTDIVLKEKKLQLTIAVFVLVSGAILFFTR